MNNSRTTRIERMMSRGENLQVKQNIIEIQKEFVTMNDDRWVTADNCTFLFFLSVCDWTPKSVLDGGPWEKNMKKKKFVKQTAEHS